MSDWLYDKVQRVPPISDAQIAEMRHIEPVLKIPESVMYRRIKDADLLDPRNVSFLWNAEPIGGEFTFDTLNVTEIITQHHSSVFFKPSLAEVYAWIRAYMPETWSRVLYFCLGEPTRIGGSSDFMCQCQVMGGRILVKGEPFIFPGGQTGYTLKEQA
jgi:hypothetical protein